MSFLCQDPRLLSEFLQFFSNKSCWWKSLSVVWVFKKFFQFQTSAVKSCFQIVYCSMFINSVARRFFLEITTFGPKNHENHEQKSSKSRKNHGVFNLNSLKIDPPDLFYCIFMHQYFSKIKNWKYFLLFMKEKYNFSKDNLLKKIRPNFWGKIKIKWTIFQLKNAELSKHFWKISKITKYFQNPLKSRSFRWFVTYHGAQIFVTRVMLKITEFVINHEFWQHC